MGIEMEMYYLLKLNVIKLGVWLAVQFVINDYKFQFEGLAAGFDFIRTILNSKQIFQEADIL